MLSSLIGRTVDFCIRHARAVILLATILGVSSAGYAAQHFVISTDISKLILPDLPWRQRQLAFQQAFPDPTESILVVVNAPTPELAREAGGAVGLCAQLRQHHRLALAAWRRGSVQDLLRY